MPLLTGPQKFLQKNHGFPGVWIRYNAVKEYIWENKQKGDVGRVAFGGPICVLYLKSLGIEVQHNQKGSEWDFGVFSGIEGVEKPNPKIYEIALQKAGNIHPSEALHIGDSMRKDYIPARSVGMHALLLDRFKSPDAASWSEAGAPVVPDLVAAQDWIMGQEEKESPIREAS